MIDAHKSSIMEKINKLILPNKKIPATNYNEIEPQLLKLGLNNLNF